MAAFQVSGMAGDIIASTSSEQFDLSGFTEPRVRDMVIAAFTNPLTAPTEMIRFTFIVGGGKLVRSRYAEDLSKWLTTALREVGFVEDRSAAETFDSQGTFKQQHDTGQNLKYVIVFPRVTCSEAQAQKVVERRHDVSSPEHLLMSSEIGTFQEIIKTKTTSWRQRKHLLKIYEDLHQKYQNIEAKLVSGIVLDSAEQEMYDANSGCDAEKLLWLQQEIKNMVENGNLTNCEKEELIASINSNIASTSLEIAVATADGKPIKIQKLEEKKRAMEARLAAVQAITPVRHRLRHGEELLRLRVSLLSFSALEDKARSMSLTLADLKTLEGKSAIEDSIAQLEQASREWYEAEGDFQARCTVEVKEAARRFANKPKPQASKKCSSSSGRTGVGAGWATVGGTSGSKHKAAGKQTGGFAAAFGDSDSD